MKYPNIEAERVRHDMSKEEFADTLGVARKTVYNWEQNGHIPQTYLERMADLFGCSIDYLLSTTPRSAE